MTEWMNEEKLNWDWGLNAPFQGNVACLYNDNRRTVAFSWAAGWQFVTEKPEHMERTQNELFY